MHFIQPIKYTSLIYLVQRFHFGGEGAEQGEGPVLSVHCIHSNVFSKFECIMKTKFSLKHNWDGMSCQYFLCKNIPEISTFSWRKSGEILKTCAQPFRFQERPTCYIYFVNKLWNQGKLKRLFLDAQHLVRRSYMS